MKKNFNKPVTSLDQQIKLLRDRGLFIKDEERAKRYLSNIFYYRLSSYFVPYQSENDQFLEDTEFNDILNTYIFDRELRLIVLDALERIEIAIRSKICNYVCDETKDPFWIYNADNFISINGGFTRITKNIQNIIFRDVRYNRYSIKTPIQHYQNIYNQPEKPAVWMIFDSLSFGDLQLIYSSLKNNHLKKKIAYELGINQILLESWLKNFQMVRNICAHHSRLWNRGFGTSPAIPKSRNIMWIEDGISGNKLYLSIVAIQVILYKISPKSSWIARLKSLLQKYPNIDIQSMGFTENWEDDIFWKQ